MEMSSVGCTEKQSCNNRTGDKIIRELQNIYISQEN